MCRDTKGVADINTHQQMSLRVGSGRQGATAEGKVRQQCLSNHFQSENENTPSTENTPTFAQSVI